MARQLLELLLETIGKIDPRIPDEYKRLVAKCSTDCIERPMDGKPRSITFVTNFVPVIDKNKKDAECEDVVVSFEISDKVPKAKTRAYPMIPTRNGVKFNASNPTQINQPSLYGSDETPPSMQ